jgi:multidrug efflux pump subunit AcrB
MLEKYTTVQHAGYQLRAARYAATKACQVRTRPVLVLLAACWMGTRLVARTTGEVPVVGHHPRLVA